MLTVVAFVHRSLCGAAIRVGTGVSKTWARVNVAVSVLARANTQAVLRPNRLIRLSPDY
jgi:hypothetical protein